MALIFLCGLPGAGKSAVGEQLASMRGSPFLDLDSEIERVAGKSIPAIFQSQGEAQFRSLESHCLAESLLLENTVIALGGGALESDDNFVRIKNRGTLVYLQTTSATIANRIANETHRPLLAGAESPDQIKLKLDELLLRREKRYLQASIVVDTTDKSPAQIAEEILSLLPQ